MATKLVRKLTFFNSHLNIEEKFVMRTLSWSKLCLFGARYKGCYSVILPRLRRGKEQNQLNFTEGKCKYGFLSVFYMGEPAVHQLEWQWC